MFTGLVEGLGKVSLVRRIGGEMQVVVQPLFPFEDGRVGESVCVDGACLTVTAMENGKIEMDVSQETLSKTTLGRLKPGDLINIERALRLGDRLGGHLVSGHVDGLGTVLKKEARQKSWFLRIGVDKRLSRYIIPKGSIAVDGISLTVNACTEEAFEVNIIPQTQRETTLIGKKAGDSVNIETDLIGKYVDKLFSSEPSRPASGAGGRIDRDMLQRHGFGDPDADR